MFCTHSHFLHGNIAILWIVEFTSSQHTARRILHQQDLRELRRRKQKHCNTKYLETGYNEV